MSKFGQAKLLEHDIDTKKVNKNYALDLVKRALKIAELKRKPNLPLFWYTDL